MTFFPDRFIFLQIGEIEIRWYAVLILCGALVTYACLNHNLKKIGYPDGTADDLFIGMILCGLVFARLWYVLFYDLKGYLANPITIIEIWNGGSAIQGGILGGVIFLIIYARKHKMSVWRILDNLAPYVLLAQAIGRWGNFANQECFGLTVDESYYNGILSFIKNSMYIDGAFREPMFLYESILCVIGFVLIMLYKKYAPKLKRGDLTFCYFLWYGAIRFWIESHRTDSLMIGGLKMAQVTSVVYIILSLMGLLGVFSKFINRNRKPVIIFDLDNTLLDTSELIIASFEHVLQKHAPGKKMSNDDKNYVLGPTLEEGFARLLPGQDPAPLIEEYRTFNKANHKRYVKTMPHVPELLDYLSQNDYVMAVASNKTKSTCQLGLDTCGLQKYFKVVVGCEEVKNPKPDKETLVKTFKALNMGTDCAVYIGDNANDVLCGINMGVFTIGYDGNPDKTEQLQNSHPNRMVKDMLEIKTILKEDHEWTTELL